MKKIRYMILSAVLAAAAQSIASAQTLDWERHHGSEAAARAIVGTSDGGYIIVGDAAGVDGSLMYILKTDATGNRQWNKLFGGTNGDDHANAYAVQQAPDGGYMIAGGRGTRVTVMKLSSTGDSLWSKVYGGDGMGSALSIQRLSDGGYAVAGYIFPTGSNTGQLHLFKIDANGNQAWEKLYGGTGYDGGSAVRQLTDGSLIVAGYTDVAGTTQPYLLKTDASGTRLWEKTYSGVSGAANDVRLASDGGFIIAGDRGMSSTAFDTDVMLLKTDASGVRQWERTFGGVGYDGGNGVMQTSDGGYVVVGFDGPVTDYINLRVYVLKTDAAGAKVWDHSPNEGFAHGLSLVNANSVVLAGKSLEKAYIARVTYSAPSTPRYFVLVDAKDRPIANRDVTLYRATMKPGNDAEVAVRRTDALGRVLIDETWYDNEDDVRIATVVHTELTKRPDHEALDNVAYRIVLDNVSFSEVSSLPATAVKFHEYEASPSVVEQKITLGHATVLFDLVVSIEWDADDDYIADLMSGIPMVANYLYDVTDGQVTLGRVLVVENKDLWDGADVALTASIETWPNAGLRGFLYNEQGRQPAYMPRRWYGDPSFNRARNVLSNWLALSTEDHWRTLAHELGHQLFGFRDEYIDPLGKQIAFGRNLGFMDSHYPEQTMIDVESPYPSIVDGIFASEMSTADRYRPEDKVARQFVLQGDCWSFFERQYEKEYGGVFVPIVKPDENSLSGGGIALFGPNDKKYTEAAYDASSLVQMRVYTNSTQLLKPIAQLVINKNGASIPAPGIDIVLRNSSAQPIAMGKTNKDGRLRIVGARRGDTYIASGEIDGKLQSIELALSMLEHEVDHTSPIAIDDSAVVAELLPISGDYVFVPLAQYATTGGLELALGMNRQFTQDPGFRLWIDSTTQIDRALSFSQSRSAYTTTLDSLPASGMAIVTGFDESRRSFPMFLWYTSSGFVNDMYGSRGSVRLLLDSTNVSTLDRLSIISSALPSPVAGLDLNARRAGDVHALALAPSVATLTGGNGLTIRYSDEDIATQAEESLRIYRWDPTAMQWVKAGGTVDTLLNEVTVEISGGGTFAAFTTTTAANIDDVSGDRGELSLSTIESAGRTTIELSVARPGMTRVEIYDSRGSLVARVAASDLSPGVHRFFWQHADVAAGVYHCVARTSSSRVASKVTVIR